VMPATVVESVVASLQPMADGKSIAIARHLDADAGPVNADPDRLQQVVWNLLTNALKFTPEGGHVTVTLRRDVPSGSVELFVADDGEGISPEFIPHVFQRFRQADSSSQRAHGGLGLGLAIVRHLVELHGGKVRVASEGVGRGAVFCVQLPAIKEPNARLAVPAEASASEPEGADGVRGGELTGVRIVLVDDEDDGRDVVGRILTQSGASVLTAASAHQALSVIEGSNVDVLISDVGMPYMDGYVMLQTLRARGFRLPAIALTAFARHEDKLKALTAGYALHLAKPVEPALLVASVSQLVQGHGRTL